MRKRQFHEEIDACRPGSGDVDQPEMSRLAEALAHDPLLRARYDATQRFDARLTETFADVAVPPGLAERILAALPRQTPFQPAPSQRASTLAPEPLSVQSATNLAAPASRLRQFRSRRAMLLATAASLLLGLGLWQGLRAPTLPGESEITSEAALWYHDLPDAWQDIAKAPADLPVSAAIAVSPRSWQAVAKTVSRRGIVYRLRADAGGQAVLFALAAKRPGLPTAAPLIPQSATGGLSIGVWQSQGVTYVLVVAGDERAYRRFLRTGRQPLA